MSARGLRLEQRIDLGNAIHFGYQPHAVGGARGLIVSIPCGRYRRLIDVQGTLTPAGRYFYDKKEQRAPDHGFDYTHSQAGQGAAR